MKIKITLLGLFFANSIIHPVYADRYDFPLETDETDEVSIVVQNDLKGAEEAEKDEAKSENLIKLGTTVAMGPGVVYQDKATLFKNSLDVQLTFKADVPKAWCNKDATVNIGANWDGKSFTIKKAAVAIGKMLTMGHTSSIFGYEKTDSSFLISGGPSVLQIKSEHVFDWFRIEYAIERPVTLEVGLFDKNKSEEKSDEKEKKTANKLDDLKDKKRPFQVKNGLPALGLRLGVVTDQLNIGLSGLGRFTDYTHSTHRDDDEKSLDTMYYLTYGGDLGIQYQFVPEKFTGTLEGVYVHGLGDYLSGLAALQKDEERKEMGAVYYIDKEKDTLYAIDAYGVGATLEYAVTPKWTCSIRGSYLTTLEIPQKPAQAFREQWNIVPKVAYAVNKYFTLSGGYSLVKESKIDDKKSKGFAQKLSGGIKFSL